MAEARRTRRQRKLDQAEIPEEHLTITDELLGKGGFGEVYLADYNGHNAAAKVRNRVDKLNASPSTWSGRAKWHSIVPLAIANHTSRVDGWVECNGMVMTSYIGSGHKANLLSSAVHAGLIDAHSWRNEPHPQLVGTRST